MTAAGAFGSRGKREKTREMIASNVVVSVPLLRLPVARAENPVV
jgi:hypothetical protein